MKVLAGLLILVVAGLSWALYQQNENHLRQTAALQQSNEVIIVQFSNRWETTRKTLEDQKRVNESLETNLSVRAKELDKLRVDLSSLATDLAKSREETKSAQEEIAKRDNQINSLESKNVDLTKQMGELQNAIASRERLINETERKLAASEGNRQELLKDLKRLQDEKLTLEKQLNDLAFVRDQVRKLREELTIARRLDWIRRGIYGTSTRKGAEALADLKFKGEPNQTTPGAPGLDVEIKRSGEVKIAPITNPPPAQPQ